MSHVRVAPHRDRREEHEERERDLKAHCDYIQSIIDENLKHQEHQNNKYEEANKHYMNYHVPESEIKLLTEENKKILNTLNKLQRKYYFKALEYGTKNKLLMDVLKVYIESKK
jgi:hypothetical protein